MQTSESLMRGEERIDSVLFFSLSISVPYLMKSTNELVGGSNDELNQFIERLVWRR